MDTNDNVIDGITVPAFETAERREEIRTKFKIRPDDVLIATYPKSGTTWTQNIVRHLLLPNSDWDKDLDDVIPWIDYAGYSHAPMEGIEAMPSPRCVKTHCPAVWLDDLFKGSTTNKIVFCYRNPKDVAVSMYKFFQLPRPHGKPKIPEGVSFQDFFTGLYMNPDRAHYSGWENHLSGWMELKDERNMLVLKFEDMKEYPTREIIRIADFLGTPYDDALIEKVAHATSFKVMKNDPKCNKSAHFTGGGFMRSGKVGGWEGYLTDEQVKELDDMAKVIEEKYGL